MLKTKLSYIVFAVCILFAADVFAADPMRTDFSYADCQGSLMPYPVAVERVQYPDTLVPVFINHVGRHGSRYPASAANCRKLADALHRAADASTITPLGRSLSEFNERMMALSDSRWGALDSLGEAEQRLIASRMYAAFTPVLASGSVNAISSYSPRCMMSMYAFTHQLDRLDNKIEFTTSTGRINSLLLRFFDLDNDYIDFRKSAIVADTYNDFFTANCPTTAIDRVLGIDFPYADDAEKFDLAITEYYVLAGASAMSMPVDLKTYFSAHEINKLWSCFNLRQYLQRTATTLSTLPADIASQLLLNLIETTDAAVDGKSETSVLLRFGHAETLMPLLSLMHLPGCYYMTNYFDTVALHWQDFNVVPMAANLQLILFRNARNGRYYVRVDLNERPMPLLPNSTEIYTEWSAARNFLLRCVPFYAR